MSDYNTYFREQMQQWNLTRKGPPPVYNNSIPATTGVTKQKFNLVDAIAELARQQPELAVWIYEHWSLKQDQSVKIINEKAKLISHYDESFYNQEDE
jgi:hypothetical protein